MKRFHVSARHPVSCHCCCSQWIWFRRVRLRQQQPTRGRHNPINKAYRVRRIFAFW